MRPLVTNTLPTRNPNETGAGHAAYMLRNLASLPLVAVRVTIGSILVLSRLVMLERMIDELDET